MDREPVHRESYGPHGFAAWVTLGIAFVSVLVVALKAVLLATTPARLAGGFQGWSFFHDPVLLGVGGVIMISGVAAALSLARAAWRPSMKPAVLLVSAALALSFVLLGTYLFGNAIAFFPGPLPGPA